MAVLNETLKTVFLDEPLVPMPKFRHYWSSLPGARVLGHPGISYGELVDTGILSIQDRVELRFFTVICNPAVVFLRRKAASMLFCDQPMDYALVAYEGRPLFVQAPDCQFHIYRENFNRHLDTLFALLNLPKTTVEIEAWPEDTEWWEQYTPQQLHWMLSHMPEVERYHFDTELRSVMRKRTT